MSIVSTEQATSTAIEKEPEQATWLRQRKNEVATWTALDWNPEQATWGLRQRKNGPVTWNSAW